LQPFDLADSWDAFEGKMIATPPLLGQRHLKNLTNLARISLDKIGDELRLSSSGPDEQGASFIVMDNVTITAELPPPLPTLSINTKSVFYRL
jgi:hypothetical protein